MNAQEMAENFADDLEDNYLFPHEIKRLVELLQKVWDKACEEQVIKMWDKIQNGGPSWIKPEFNIDSL